MLFRRLSSVAIEAYGAELIFSGLTRPLTFYHCAKVSVRGLTISWAPPPFSQGDIKSLSADGKTVVIALDAQTPMDGWTKVEAIGSYDRGSGLIQRHGVDVYNCVQSVEPLSPNMARLSLKWRIGLRRGETLVLRHAIYQAPAVNFQGCDDVIVEDITVHTVPGMAFVGGNCRNVRLRRCVIAPTAGYGLLMTTCADGAHFGNCSGEILVEDCRFSKMGDDGVNVNTSYLRIVGEPDQRTATAARRLDAPFRDQDVARPGDRFEFSSSKTLETRGDDEVESAAAPPPAPQTLETIRFKRELPAGVKPGDVLIDKSRSPRTTVRNCQFEASAGPGVLVHQNAVIQNCLFRNLFMQGVVLVPNLYWMEGAEVANVRVVNSCLRRVDRKGGNQGAVLVDAFVVGPKGWPRSSSGKPNHDIVIKGNQFKNIEGRPIVIHATR